MGNGRRLELLDLLAQGPRYVDALAAEMATSIANVSQHLNILRHAKLVDSQREGTRMLYRLTDASILRLWLQLRSVAEDHLPEVSLLRAASSQAQQPARLPRRELDQLMLADQALVVDVRPPEEYNAGHLPGAVNMLSRELDTRAESLPSDKRIIVYGRGPFCPLAHEAVRLLLDHGRTAVQLDGGWPDWLCDGRDALLRLTFDSDHAPSEAIRSAMEAMYGRPKAG